MDKCYSTNNEDFNLTEAGDALDALANKGRLVTGEIYYECDCEPVVIASYLTADRILEQAGEQIYDDIGEAADDAFSASPEAKAELDAFVTAWTEKHIRGHYWRCVGPSREIKVTAADLAALAD
jgi:hypothetical protein